MKVSVAICTYNGEKYIEEQLNSILSQTCQVDEIIVCDDGSSDQTLTIVSQKLKDFPSYQLHQNKTSLGVVKNFKQCYQLCTGDIVFSCDQDDVWRCDKVEKIMSIFERSEINLVASNAILINAKGESLHKNLRDEVGFLVPASYTGWIDLLLQWFCVTGATMAFRKSLFDEVFFESDFWLHDGWLAMFAALKNSMEYIDENLIEYRLHGNNACGIGMFKVVPTALKKPYFFEDFAKQRTDLYGEVKLFLNDNKIECVEENEFKLNKCCSFWKKRSQIKKYSLRQCDTMRKTFRENGEYNQFTKEKAYYWLDLYFWLVYKVRPRKK